MLLLLGMSQREQQEGGQRLGDRTQRLPQLGKAWVLILRPLLFKRFWLILGSSTLGLRTYQSRWVLEVLEDRVKELRE